VSHAAELILSLHGWVALLVVFLLPALEASAFFGILFPGEIAVILGGVLAFQGRIKLVEAIAAAILGAVLGDSVGYAVGKRWGRRMLDASVGRLRLVKAEHLDRAERFLGHHGGKAVFLGRWTAALRVLIPGLTGMSGVRYRTFLLYNVLGGALWASAFVLLGYAAGEGWRTIETVAKRASLVLLLLVLIVGSVVVLARWMAANPQRVRAAIDRQLARPWVARLGERYERQLAFLARRLRPEGALGLSLTLGMVGVVFAGWVFGAVLQDVLAHEQLTRVDASVQSFFHAHREPWLTSMLRAAAALGAARVLLPVALLAGLGWRLRQGRWRPLATLLAALGGAELLVALVKALVERPRPPLVEAAAQGAGFAFPSGHATAATAVCGALAALAVASTGSWTRWVVAWAAASLVVLVVGFSQVYLGASWLSDVLGGVALGGLWLVVLLTAGRTLAGLRQHAAAPAPVGRDRAG
jgi:membrane protein DedA with SNARE-associated domain/membrane-associated phospholipid phosphatase